MRKPFAALFSACLLWAAAHTQTPAIDSLARLLQDAPKDQLLQAAHQLEQGQYYYQHASYDSALYFFESVRKMPASPSLYASRIKAINGIGNIYSDKGDNVKALPYFQEALTLAEQNNDPLQAARVTKNIGILYVQWKNFPEALRYYQRAMDMATRQGDLALAADCYNNIGIIYEQQQKYPEALEVYQKALGYYTQAGKKDRMAMALSNMAIVYKFTGELDKSIESNLKSLALSRETGDKWSEGATLNNLASALIRKKEYSKANTYALEAEQVARSLGAKEILVATYETLAEIAHESGRAEESFNYLKTMMAVKDSFINLESTRQMAELQTRYETAKTERALLEERFEVSRKNYQLMAALGLLVLGSLLGFNGYRRYTLRKEKELAEAIMRQQDLATRAVMEAEENERRRIATELHDGVGQMMSAARMNLSAFESEMEQLDPGYRQKLERIVNLVDESCREVRSVSHSMMPNALLKKGLAAAVHDFIDKIDSKVLQVNLYTEGLDDRMDPAVESMLYRVIQECVNNVIRHSGASQLDISLVSEEDGISLTVEDNGKGFDTSRKDLFDGIGLRNIRSRVQYLKGTVEFDSTPGKGTLVAAHIPRAVQ